MPNIIHETSKGLQLVPIRDAFLRDRKVFLLGTVNEESCNELIQELLFLEAMDRTAPVTLFINSPGGEVGSGLAVYDTIRLMKSPVTAVVTGCAASMGSIILLACEKERRFMLQSSKIMIHDCSWGRHDVGGKKPHEIQTELDQLKDTNEKLLSIIAERCDKSVDEVAEYTRFDSYFDADEAIAFGLVSAVVDEKNFGFITKKGEW